MTRKNVSTLLLAGVAALQLAVPLYRVWAQERTLARGQAVRLRTAPVDPYDAFRGRYVALAFDAAQQASPQEAFQSGDDIVVVLRNDEDGFAVVDRLQREAPLEAQALYFTAEVLWVSRQEIRLRFPFERYYLDEDEAPAAEAAYRERSRRGARDAYAVVRLHHGRAALEELVVGGVPIRDYLEERE